MLRSVRVIQETTVKKRLIRRRCDLTGLSSGFFYGLYKYFLFLFLFCFCFVFLDSSDILEEKSREDRRSLFFMKRYTTIPGLF